MTQMFRYGAFVSQTLIDTIAAWLVGCHCNRIKLLRVWDASRLQHRHGWNVISGSRLLRTLGLRVDTSKAGRATY